jgi:hypothetical protein
MTAQVKLQQMERSSVKYDIPVAKRTIGATPGYFQTYMTLPDLIDSLNINLGTLDSIYLQNDTIFLRDGSGFVKLPTGGGLDSIYLQNDTIFLRDGSGFVDLSGLGGGSGTVTSVGLTTGTTGTDINVTNSPVTTSGNININIPTASATNRGALSSADWSTFNGKVGGIGTATQVAYWADSDSLTGNSNLVWDALNNRLALRSHNESINIGLTAGNNSQGDLNVNIGSQAGQLAIGTNNINIGRQVGRQNQGSFNINIGFANNSQAGNTGSSNVYIGRVVANGTGSHFENVGLGYFALQKVTSGSRNVANGSYSLNNLTTGSNNVGLGFYAAGGVTTGNSNLAIGDYALAFGSGPRIRNVAIGSYALSSTEGEGNVGIGFNASLFANRFNVAIGQSALQGSTTTTGSEYNVAIGLQAGFLSGGNRNVYIGSQAGYYNTGSDRLYIENSLSDTPLIGGHFDNNRIGINTEINSIARTLHVTGEARITDLITDPPTYIVGADNDGDLSRITLGTGLSFDGTTLNTSGTSPQTWAEFGSDVVNWGATGNSNSGKWIGIGTLTPLSVFHVKGNSTLEGVIYSATGAAGTSGQVLTSQGSGSPWTWTTISASDNQNLSYGTKSGNRIPLDIQRGVGVNVDQGEGVVIDRTSSNVITFHNVTSHYAQLSNSSFIEVNQSLTTSYQKINFETSQSNVISVSAANDNITVLANGRYEVTLNVCARLPSGAASSDIIFQLHVNNSSTGLGVGYYKLNDLVALDTECGGKSIILSLNANDVVDWRFLRSGGDATNIDWFAHNLSVKRIE